MCLWKKAFCLLNPNNKKSLLNQQQEQFQCVMQYATNISARDPLALTGVVRLIANSLQNRVSSSIMYQPPHQAHDKIELQNLIGNLDYQITRDGKSAQDLIKRTSNKEHQYILKLGCDPILATPCSEASFTSMISSVGHSLEYGKWQQNPNHQIQWLLPFGLGIVLSGNHSLTAGIANFYATKVITTEVVDLCNVYEHLHYDGINMVRNYDNKPFFQPQDEELGILFELGRLMLKNKVTCNTQLANHRIPFDYTDKGICYKVFVNGQDTGCSLSGSGVARLIKQHQYDSDQENSIIIKGETFNIANKQVNLKHYMPRRIFDDLNSALKQIQ